MSGQRFSVRWYAAGMFLVFAILAGIFALNGVPLWMVGLVLLSGAILAGNALRKG